MSPPGIESFSKLGDSIYFEAGGEVPGLYVIQYISSSLYWNSGQLVLSQKVDPVVSWDSHLRATFIISHTEVFREIKLFYRPIKFGSPFRKHPTCIRLFPILLHLSSFVFHIVSLKKV